MEHRHATRIRRAERGRARPLCCTGLNFRATKHEAVYAARRNAAPDPVVAQLEAVPQTRFESLDDLRRAYAAGAEPGP
jgi:hypothetical protein